MDPQQKLGNDLDIKLPGGFAAHVTGGNLVLIVVMVTLMAGMGYVLHYGLKDIKEAMASLAVEQRRTNVILLFPQEERKEMFRRQLGDLGER